MSDKIQWYLDNYDLCVAKSQESKACEERYKQWAMEDDEPDAPRA
jgi:hypothetical protein